MRQEQDLFKVMKYGSHLIQYLDASSLFPRCLPARAGACAHSSYADPTLAPVAVTPGMGPCSYICDYLHQHIRFESAYHLNTTVVSRD